MVEMMTNLVPKNAQTDEEIEKCFDVMLELRTNLKREQFLETIRQMEQQGYQLAYLADNDQVVAVAGYRIGFNLFLGKHLYIDDLVTSAAVRSKGYGETLYSWLKGVAIKQECTHIHLDSGVHRGHTHRFYFRQGLTISSFHFREKLID
ncbi:MAG: GNAT family N-acetyltransferase [Chloroflexota bacterium]